MKISRQALSHKFVIGAVEQYWSDEVSIACRVGDTPQLGKTPFNRRNTMQNMRSIDAILAVAGLFSFPLNRSGARHSWRRRSRCGVGRRAVKGELAREPAMPDVTSDEPPLTEIAEGKRHYRELQKNNDKCKKLLPNDSLSPLGVRTYGGWSI
jgi:hypothetical protein